MKKILFLLVFAVYGATAQNVTVNFENAPEKLRAMWMESDFMEPKEVAATGTLRIPTINGVAELALMKSRMTSTKFLLREGDTVNITFDEKGHPTATNPEDPEFDAVYNFPASVAGMPMPSPDALTYDKRRTQMGMPGNPEMNTAFEEYFAKFTAAVDAAEMPEVYKKYYKEAYFGTGGEPVYDDDMVRYYAINEGLTTYVDGMMMGFLRPTGGKGGPEFDEAVTAKFDEIAADVAIPPLTKTVILRSMLHKSTSILDLATEIEYLGKYTELTGEDLLAEYKPYTGEQTEIDVALENNTGEVFELKDVIASHNGKVIMVDLWASWCKPCLQSMPVSAKLREMYPEIVFLYISVDDNREAWIGKEAELALHDSYRITDKKTSSFLNDVLGGVNSVPRYLILDREGKMVYDKTPIPSGRLGVLFERL